MASLNDIETKVHHIINLLDARTIKTITAVLPITFTTTEDKLRDWEIKGNDDVYEGQQGVGERTVNLLPPIIGANGWSAGYRNKVTGEANPASGYGEVLTPRITVGNSETFTIKAEHNTPPATGAGAAGTVYFFDNSDNYIGYAEFTDYSGAVITVQSGAASFDFAIRTGYVGLPTVEASDFWVELVKGSTAPSTYVPFGYEIPISVNGNEQIFYIGSTPLTAGQSISKTSTGVDIATSEGENTISTSLYNKPEMTIKYK